MFKDTVIAEHGHTQLAVGHHWNPFIVTLQRMQELMQRPQLFKEGEGHMRLLLMPLISQAIYYAVGPGRGSWRRAELDAEKKSRRESKENQGNGARG